MSVPSNSKTRPARVDVRDDVVAAARAEFGDRGYAATSVAQIAARAGYTKGAVYSNFGGKPELFAAAMQASFTELVGELFSGALTVAAETAGRPSARAMARALTGDVLRDTRWSSMLGEFRAVAGADPDLTRLYADLRRRQRAQLVDALRSAGTQVKLRAGLDLEVAATVLLGIAHDLTVEHAVAPDALPSDLMESVLAQVLDGILA